MKLAIMQPYFLPYIGYWQLINSVDKFVAYDDVNYIKKGWINRNNILFNGEKRLFTISIQGASQNKLIKQLEIIDDFSSFLRILQISYSNSPYFSETMELIQKIVSYDEKNLALFIINSIKCISAHLGIATEIIISSELAKNNSLKAQDKIIDICKLLVASEYHNPIGGIELYDRNAFSKYGIDLKFINSFIKPYRQFSNDFVPGLSIIDIMMFNSTDYIKEMLEAYEFV